MIEKRYRQSLIRVEGKKGAVLVIVIYLVPLFFLICGCLNLWLASRLGSIEGHSLSSFFRLWLTEIDTNKSYTYSGVFLLAFEKFNTGVVQVVLSPMSHLQNTSKRLELVA